MAVVQDPCAASMRQQTQLCQCWSRLQALRLDEYAAWTLANGSLLGIASMGDRLRQLALLGLARVTDENLLAALAQLPLLQVTTLIVLVSKGTST